MSRGIFGSPGALGAMALAVAVATIGAASSVAGQAQTAAPKKPAAGAAASKKFVAKRLPWGDPDISGNFTTKDEANTPLERPDEFAGRKIEDITPAEMAAIRAARQQTAVETAPFITGSRTDGIAIGVPIHWLDHLDSVNNRPWFVTDPPDGKIPPLSDEGKKRVDGINTYLLTGPTANTYLDRSPQDRCIAWGIGPARILPGVYGMSHQILQTKDYVVLRLEMINETRFVPIEGRGAARPHRSAALRTYYGDAVGRWEGDTFVVETTNYKMLAGGPLNNRMPFRGASEGLKTIERFTRTGPGKLEYSATFEDAAMWTRPWTFSIPWTEDDTQAIHEYACHEGNYGLRNILAGGREDQKRGIEPSNGPAIPPEQQE